MKKSVVVKMQQDFEDRSQISCRWQTGMKAKSIWNMVTAVSMRRALWG